EYLCFTLYGNDRVCDRIRSTYPDWPIECVQTRSFEAFQHAEFVVTPIEANHNRKEDCQNHIIQRAGKALLYATDTGVWRAPTWNFLKDFRLDALVIECTEGLCATGFDGHLDLFECAEVVARLRAQGSLNPKARVVTTHHSHLGNATHGELTKALAPHGIEPGFDGMVFEL
ncbi:MAG: hypothetical protein HY248_01220, partial [Fimbriimonas ginsengisoli]|nr:hypothetical protein [Fimbriimonas ginsengisoli]